jgi:FkbM family methyltransferase
MDKNEIYRNLNKAYFSEERHEKEVLDHLPVLLEGVRVFADVGASLGQYTFFANKHLQGGRIFAIEADPIRFEELRNNCQKWEFSSTNKLTALHAAVCDKDGKTAFYVTNSSVSGGLFTHDIRHQAVDWQEIVINCFKLDTIFRDCSPDLVKIDVEGSELRVLRGAIRILRKGKTKFLVELHSFVDPEGQGGPEEVLDFMKSFGYSPTNFHGHRLFVKPGASQHERRAGSFLRRLKDFAKVQLARIF